MVGGDLLSRCGPAHPRRRMGTGGATRPTGSRRPRHDEKGGDRPRTPGGDRAQTTSLEARRFPDPINVFRYNQHIAPRAIRTPGPQ